MFGDHPLIILFPSQTNWFKVAKHAPQAISNLRAIDISRFKAQILSIKEKKKKSRDAPAIFPPCLSTGGNKQWGTRILSTCFFSRPDYTTYLLSQLPSQLQTCTKFGSKSASLCWPRNRANKASAFRPLQTQHTRQNSPQEPDLKSNGTFLLPKCSRGKKKIYENSASSWICCQCRRDTLQVLVPLATDRYRELNQAPGS